MQEEYHNHGNVCEFDSKDWEILKEFNHYSLILHYKHANVKGTVTVPKNLVNPEYLFSKCIIEDGCTIIFQSGVKCIRGMFKGCTFGRNVKIIGLRSALPNCVDATELFCSCRFSSEVYLDSVLKVDCDSGIENMFAYSNYEVAFKHKVFELTTDCSCYFGYGFKGAVLGENCFDCIELNCLKDSTDFSLYGLFEESIITKKEILFKTTKDDRVLLNSAFREAKFKVNKFKLCVTAKDNAEGVLCNAFERADLPMFLSLDVNPQRCKIPQEVMEHYLNSGVFDDYYYPSYYHMFEGSSPKYVHFSERMFNGPEEAYLGMFGGCNLPSYITASEPQEIMRQFNEAYKWYESQPDDILEQCKRELIKLLSSGKSVSVATKLLQDKYAYIDIEKISENVSTVLTEECSKNVLNLFEIPSGSSYCRYTIGDVVEKLVKAGYPRDVVNECVIGYIRDQYISL